MVSPGLDYTQFGPEFDVFPFNPTTNPPDIQEKDFLTLSTSYLSKKVLRNSLEDLPNPDQNPFQSNHSPSFD